MKKSLDSLFIIAIFFTFTIGQYQNAYDRVTPQVLDLRSDGHHTKVICFLSKNIANIKSVKIKNEFLLNVASHSNIVELDINNTFRDFRLHDQRREIKVDYN